MSRDARLLAAEGSCPFQLSVLRASLVSNHLNGRHLHQVKVADGENFYKKKFYHHCWLDPKQDEAIKGPSVHDI